jgi:FAD/FMN-containing dehydrogenase
MTLLAGLTALLGADRVIPPETPGLADRRTDYAMTGPESGRIVAVVLPGTTEQVSGVLRLCNEAGVAIVPQGGRTGLAGGAVPVQPSVLLSLERLRAIEEIDRAGATISVEAGVMLETVQQAAEAAGFLFPLDLGARGSCTIGGNAATNAGGNRVLRYGMMRDLVLGLEAVLADGTVISSMNRMIKNNAGYDLKQLFIGSEGTLGVITRLVLRLFPPAPSVATALAALDSDEQILDLLSRAKRGFGATLSAFEVMWPDFYGFATAIQAPPLPHGSEAYVLLETMGTDPAIDQDRFETIIGEALEAGIITDAVIAQSTREAQALWAVRDASGDFPRRFAPNISFDISVPTGEIAALRADCRDRLAARWPDMEMLFFGHIADGNLHLTVRSPAPMPAHDIEELVYQAVGERRCSISAEHGIGLVKRPFLHYSRSPAEIALMRTLKATLDPNNILNPGKII